jgi:hypothetical protein
MDIRIYTFKRGFLLVFGNKNLRLDAISPDFLAENLQTRGIWHDLTQGWMVFRSAICEKVHKFFKNYSRLINIAEIATVCCRASLV